MTTNFQWMTKAQANELVLLRLSYEGLRDIVDYVVVEEIIFPRKVGDYYKIKYTVHYKEFSKEVQYFVLSKFTVQEFEFLLSEKLIDLPPQKN
jgi:peptidyl-tRNA hydrolase